MSFVCEYLCNSFISAVPTSSPTIILIPTSPNSMTSDDNSSGIVAALGAVLAAVAIALIVSITINVLLFIQKKNERLVYCIGLPFLHLRIRGCL